MPSLSHSPQLWNSTLKRKSFLSFMAWLASGSLQNRCQKRDGDMGLQALHAMNARASRGSHGELCPGDYRITAWLGPILINTGRFMQDEAMIEEGLAILDEGIANYPEFVLFSQSCSPTPMKTSTVPSSKMLLKRFEPTHLPVAVTRLSPMPALSSNPTLKIQPALTTSELRTMSRVLLSLSAMSTSRLVTTRPRPAFTQGLETIDSKNWQYRSLLEDRLADLETFRKKHPNGMQRMDVVGSGAPKSNVRFCHGAK